VESNHLDLNTPILEYLKDWELLEKAFKLKEKKVTVVRLLSTTAGLLISAIGEEYPMTSELPDLKENLSQEALLFQSGGLLTHLFNIPLPKNAMSQPSVVPLVDGNLIPDPTIHYFTSHLNAKMSVERLDVVPDNRRSVTELDSGEVPTTIPLNQKDERGEARHRPPCGELPTTHLTQR